MLLLIECCPVAQNSRIGDASCIRFEKPNWTVARATWFGNENDAVCAMQIASARARSYEMWTVGSQHINSVATTQSPQRMVGQDVLTWSWHVESSLMAAWWILVVTWQEYVERRTFHESCKVEDAQLHSELVSWMWRARRDLEPRIPPAVCKLCCVVVDRNSSIVPWYCHLVPCACDSQLIQV